MKRTRGTSRTGLSTISGLIHLCCDCTLISLLVASALLCVWSCHVFFRYMEEYESVMKLDVVRPVTVTGVKRTAMGTYLVETDCLMGGAPAQWECRAVISGKSVLLSSCVRVFVYSPPRLPMIIFPFFFPCFIPLSPSILFFSLFSSSPSIPNFSPSVLPSIFLNPSVFFFPFFSHSFSSFHVSCSSTFFSPLVAPPPSS